MAACARPPLLAYELCYRPWTDLCMKLCSSLMLLNRVIPSASQLSNIIRWSYIEKDPLNEIRQQSIVVLDEEGKNTVKHLQAHPVLPDKRLSAFLFLSLASAAELQAAGQAQLLYLEAHTALRIVSILNSAIRALSYHQGFYQNHALPPFTPRAITSTAHS